MMISVSLSIGYSNLLCVHCITAQISDATGLGDFTCVLLGAFRTSCHLMLGITRYEVCLQLRASIIFSGILMMAVHGLLQPMFRRTTYPG